MGRYLLFATMKRGKVLHNISMVTVTHKLFFSKYYLTRQVGTIPAAHCCISLDGERIDSIGYYVVFAGC